MQLHELKYFAAIVDSGSISRAAEVVGISQPALTKCIRQMEQRLHVRLLERSSRGVKPTAYGETLYVRAKSITSELSRAEAEIEAMSRTSAGMLTIGVLPSQATHALPEAAARLMATRRGLRIRIIEKPRPDLIAGLRRGEFELIVSVADRSENDPAIADKILFHDRPALVVRREHPLAGVSRPGRAQLARFPWVVPPPGTERRSYMEDLFRPWGMAVPSNIVECHSVSFVKAIVQRGDYIGILPTDMPAPEQRAGALVPLELDPKPPARRIGVLYRADHPLTEAGRAMIRALQRAYLRHTG